MGIRHISGAVHCAVGCAAAKHHPCGALGEAVRNGVVGKRGVRNERSTFKSRESRSERLAVDPAPSLAIIAPYGFRQFAVFGQTAHNHTLLSVGPRVACHHKFRRTSDWESGINSLWHIVATWIFVVFVFVSVFQHTQHLAFVCALDAAPSHGAVGPSGALIGALVKHARNGEDIERIVRCYERLHVRCEIKCHILLFPSALTRVGGCGKHISVIVGHEAEVFAVLSHSLFCSWIATGVGQVAACALVPVE